MSIRGKLALETRKLGRPYGVVPIGMIRFERIPRVQHHEPVYVHGPLAFFIVLINGRAGYGPAWGGRVRWTRSKHCVDRLHAAGRIRGEHLLLLLLLLLLLGSLDGYDELFEFIDSLLKLFDSIFQLLNICRLLGDRRIGRKKRAPAAASANGMRSQGGLRPLYRSPVGGAIAPLSA